MPQKNIIIAKKAQYAADTAPFYVIFGIVISLLFLAFMWILAYYTTDTSKIPKDLEYDLLTERFSICFGYETLELDLSQRNTISWNKFNQGNLDDCYHTTSIDQPQFSLKLKLEIPPRASEELKTEYWIEDLMIDKEETRNVLVYHEDEIKEGQLIITTQWEKVRFA